MVRSLLRTALGGLVIALMLAGCEEMASPPNAPKAAKPSARLYTEIGADELLERWTVLPGGVVAEAASNSSGRQRAAATEGFSGLTLFRFSAAREYGACVVFTTEFEQDPNDDPGGPGAGEPGSPSEPCCTDPQDPPDPDEFARGGVRPSVEEDESEVFTRTYHFIDCVGVPAAGNTVEGLFHAAHSCEPLSGEVLYFHLLRAGHFNPSTHVHEWHNPEIGLHVVGVNAEIAGHSSDNYQWIKHITLEDGTDPVLVNWAFMGMSESWEDGILVESWGGETHGFDRLHRHQEDLHFRIDRSAGVVDVEPNDGAAFTEYRRRCASLQDRQ